jgi:DnaJ homologue, subfamily C, member 28, conserved domain
MTERKPAGMSFTSWIDQQISEAADRGAFDDLPLTGKPLPRRAENDDLAWIKEKLAREGVSADELLPPPLKLRKERQRLIDAAAQFPAERDLLEAVSDLNRRIAEWRRIPVGPPIHVPLADEDELLARWRAAHPAPVARPPAVQVQPPAPRPRARRRWFGRRRG